MTVTATNRKNSYPTNGVTTNFAFTFAVTSDQQIKALTSDAEGVETDYTNFTVSLNPSAEGGTLTTLDVLNDVTLVVYRDTPLTQQLDYVEGGRFPAESHEAAIDKLTLQNQDQQEEIDRSLKSSISNTTPPSLEEYDETVNQRDADTLASANAYTDQQVFESGSWNQALSTANIKEVTPTLTDLVFDTLSNAQNSDLLVEGGVVTLRERALDNGGGSVWDVVALSSVTPNGFNIVSHASLPLALVYRMDVQINLKSIGSTGDGSTGDDQAVQYAIDWAVTFGSGSLVPYRRSGAEVSVPNGCYRLEQQIEAKQGVVNFSGTGRFQNYPQVYEVAPTGLPAFMPVHAGRAAFHSDGTQENRKINFQDLNIATLESGTRPTAAFAWKSNANFQRDFTFDRVGIFGFESALDIYNSGGSGAGVIKVNNCAINRNTWIMRCLDGQICNKLIFKDNEAGQNSNGLDLKGHAITIEDNVLESNSNTIRVFGDYRGTKIKGNYFEANSGNYVVQVLFTKGAEIGPNFYNAITAKVPLYLFKDRDTTVNETDVMPCVEASFDPKTNQNLFALNDSDFGQKGASVAKFWSDDLISTQVAQDVTEVGTTQLTNPSGFHKNIINSAGSLRTSSGSGLVTFNQSGLSIPSDTWIGVSILVTYNDAADDFPRMTVRLNGGTADGFHEAQFAGYSNTTPSGGTDKLGGRTVLYTVIAKSTNAITSVQTQLYPWGLNPQAGLVAVTSVPFVFTKETPRFKPFIPSEFVSNATSIPTSSDFPIGWKVYNKDPQPGEYDGWVFADDGAGSGVWKGFGLVEA